MGAAPMPFAQQQLNRNPRQQMERKLKKPLMEKKRRARINRCLSELKHILLQSAPHQRSKLEKADILEMTVKYLRQKCDSDVRTVNRYFVEGYQQCARTVAQYLSSVNLAVPQKFHDSLNVHLSEQLTLFLANQSPKRLAIFLCQMMGGSCQQQQAVNIVRPTPFLPPVLTLNIPPHSSVFHPSSQLLPTPPFTAHSQHFIRACHSSNADNMSPVPTCSSSESAGSFFSFSPSATSGNIASDKEHNSVWRPW